MYFPKSKIITNLYTNGKEFFLKKNNSQYIGYYWRTYDGKFYTGKTPDNVPYQELIKINQVDDLENVFSNEKSKSSIALPYEAPTPFLSLDEYSYNEKDILEYTTLKNINLNIPSIKNLPTQYYPQPTLDEYKLGEFQRYFVKKVNELIYLEIDEDIFTAIKNKDSKYAFEYYIPFTFAWQIYGNRIDILQINRNTVLLIEQKLKIRGLQEFLKNNYDKFYQYPVVNKLNTIGGELQYANSNEYKGLYHIEADRGFVVGDKPSSINIQPTLFAINLEIEKKLLDNALKAIGEFTYPTPIYDVIRKK
jgi:hypothetical protein